MFAVAVASGIGLTLEFVKSVWIDVYVNGHQPNFLLLPIFLVGWNLLPLTFFAISRVLQKQGK